MSSTTLPAIPNGQGTPTTAVARIDHEAVLKFLGLNPRDASSQALLLTCQRYELDPVLRHMVLIQGRPYVTRDGLLHVAHRSGQFDGIEVKDQGETPSHFTAKVSVYRKDMGRPFTYIGRYPKNGGNKGYGPEMAVKCFDEWTEVLTDEGFQPFEDATGRIMQVTESGLETTDAQPFATPYDGDMVTLDSDDLNFCVTPNHDMLTTHGKIEASEMFAKARRRAKFWIPRSVTGTQPGLPIDDESIRLAAAFLADGSDMQGDLFHIAVSRPRKVHYLRELGWHQNETVVKAAGSQAVTPTRTITTQTDKIRFVYQRDRIWPLCGRHGKTPNTEAILAMGRAQARLFVDSLVFFDGHEAVNGVRRFYTSSPAIHKAFELAAVIAGYSISRPRRRRSDISTVDGMEITISDRSDIPVIRHGREYHADDGAGSRHTGLKITPNSNGWVYCVTVPSGVIVVRRNGFSMLCGNCGEVMALRRAFNVALCAREEAWDQDQAHDPAPTIDAEVSARDDVNESFPQRAERRPKPLPRDEDAGPMPEKRPAAETWAAFVARACNERRDYWNNELALGNVPQAERIRAENQLPDQHQVTNHCVTHGIKSGAIRPEDVSKDGTADGARDPSKAKAAMADLFARAPRRLAAAVQAYFAEKERELRVKLAMDDLGEADTSQEAPEAAAAVGREPGCDDDR